MSHRVPAFDKICQTAHGWVEDLAAAVDVDGESAWRALTAVLCTLRDRLPANEAVHLGAQLPVLVRGAYYDGWNPSRVPRRMDREAFLEEVAQRYVRSEPDPAVLVEAVFDLLAARISAGEILDVGRTLPDELRVLFP